MHWNQSSLVLFGCELVETRPFLLTRKTKPRYALSNQWRESHRIASHCIASLLPFVRNPPKLSQTNHLPNEYMHKWWSWQQRQRWEWIASHRIRSNGAVWCLCFDVVGRRQKNSRELTNECQFATKNVPEDVRSFFTIAKQFPRRVVISNKWGDAFMMNVEKPIN